MICHELLACSSSAGLSYAAWQVGDIGSNRWWIGHAALPPRIIICSCIYIICQRMLSLLSRMPIMNSKPLLSKRVAYGKSRVKLAFPEDRLSNEHLHFQMV
jgi:hypothetical protein